MAKAPRFETLTAGMPFAGAAGEIVRGLFDAALEEIPKALRGDDVEAVHDARVAVRRLRTALEVFRKPLGDEGGPLERAIRRLGRKLGSVRDADVHLAALRGTLGGATVEETPGVHFLLESIAVARRRALAGFAVEMSQFDRAMRTSRSSKSLAENAYATLRKLLRHVRACGDRVIGRGSGKQLHALRVAFKRLRYNVEFFRTILADDDAKAALVLLVQAQERLGTISDDDAFAAYYAAQLSSLDANDPRRIGIEARVKTVEHDREHELTCLRSLWEDDADERYPKRLRAAIRGAVASLV
jgi:CHAD domain-containing protein